MNRRRAKDVDEEEFATRASKLYHEQLESEENYARLVIQRALREHEQAERREKHSARRMEDVLGAKNCLKEAELSVKRSLRRLEEFREGLKEAELSVKRSLKRLDGAKKCLKEVELCVKRSVRRLKDGYGVEKCLESLKEAELSVKRSVVHLKGVNGAKQYLESVKEVELSVQSSVAYLEGVDGAKQCLEGLNEIVRSTRTKVIIPKLGNLKIPRYTSWVPISRDFWFQDKDDVITRYPFEAIESKDFKDDKFSVAMGEYGEFRKKFKFEHTLPSVEEIEESRSLDSQPFELRVKLAVCTNVISKVLKPLRPELRIKIAPVLQNALKIDNSVAMETIVSAAFEEAREREQRLRRKVRRAETLLAMKRGLAGESTISTSDSPLELVGQVLKHYCPMCYTMSCDLHAEECYRVTPVKPILDQSVENRLDELSEDPSPCSVRCYMLLDKPQFGKVEAGEMERWTEEETSLLEMAIPVFQKDPCSLATVVGTRTCREVFMKMCEPHWNEWTEAAIDVVKLPRRIKEDDFQPDWRLDEGIQDHFAPCNHEGPCVDGSCPCVFFRQRCESACGCNNVRCCEGPTGFGMCEAVHPTQVHPPRRRYGTNPSGKCPNIWHGCSCRPGKCDIYCPCWMMERACKPGLCACLSTTAKCSRLITGKCSCKGKRGKCDYKPCRNVFISKKGVKHTMIGKSPIHGYGLFAAETIRRGDFIGIYTGQLYSQYIAEILGFGYDTHDHTFLFDLTELVTSDATVMGSLMKFINHAGKEEDGLNCASKKQVTNGVPIIAYFATRTIRPGEELFIDYKIENNKPNWMKSK